MQNFKRFIAFMDTICVFFFLTTRGSVRAQVSGQLVDSSLFQNLWETKFRAAISLCLTFLSLFVVSMLNQRSTTEQWNWTVYLQTLVMMLRFNRVFYTFKSFGIWIHLQCLNCNSFFRDFVGHFIWCYDRGIWLRVGGGTPLILRLFCLLLYGSSGAGPDSHI